MILFHVFVLLAKTVKILFRPTVFGVTSGDEDIKMCIFEDLAYGKETAMISVDHNTNIAYCQHEDQNCFATKLQP